MSDPVSTARTARDGLRQGLAALQAPGVPQQLLDVAEPVAQAIGALHQIESTQGASLAQQAPVALDAVRRALALLQAQPQTAPVVNQAVESVAGSLGLVHQLAQGAAGQPAALAQPAARQAPMQQPTAQPAPAQHGSPGQQAPAGAGDMGMAATMYQPGAAPPPGYGATGAAAGTMGVSSTQPAQPGPGPLPASQGAWGGAPQQPQAHGPAPAAAQAPAGAGPAFRVDAELGAHSSTNFYKGLSGNDVIDSGGVFIATYQIPPIGQTLLIKVSLPGGYEFEADGVVHWTREAPHSARGVESPPGYGARFTRISQEGRQLVYRYVRNREPLFYDDL